MLIFEKQYYSDTLIDLEQDVYETLNSISNDNLETIPSDEYGFLEGVFTVTITWKEN